MKHLSIFGEFFVNFRKQFGFLNVELFNDTSVESFLEHNIKAFRLKYNFCFYTMNFDASSLI